MNIQIWYEGWTLNDVIAFSKKHKLNLIVYDSSKNTIPSTEYNKFANTKVINQSRPVGDAIIEGFNFYVNINTQYIVSIPPAGDTPGIGE